MDLSGASRRLALLMTGMLALHVLMLLSHEPAAWSGTERSHNEHLSAGMSEGTKQEAVAVPGDTGGALSMGAACLAILVSAAAAAHLKRPEAQWRSPPLEPRFRPFPLSAEPLLLLSPLDLCISRT